MYFNIGDFVNINDIINSKYTFLAHTKEDSTEKETLQDHTKLCETYFIKVVNSRKIESVFQNIEKEYFENFSDLARKIYKKMIMNVITFHDTGKINPEFQEKNMKNESFVGQKNGGFGKNHSKLSSIIYLNFFRKHIKNIENANEQKILQVFLNVNSYIISRHHSDLSDFCDLLNENTMVDEETDVTELIFLKDCETNGNNYLKDKIELDIYEYKSNYKLAKKYISDIGTSRQAISLYIYARLLFSLLVASDFYATSGFESETEINYFGNLDEIKEFYDEYKNTELYKSIKKYEKEKYPSKQPALETAEDINELRCEMFLDAENELRKNMNENIFYLEAPTGGGKSNISLNLGFKLIDKNPSLSKIFYIYPFNTLVEQNLKTLKYIYKDTEKIFDKITVINSLHSIKMKYEEQENNSIKYYSEILLDRQFLNYPFILTTHVSIFNTMFSNTKEDAFAFHQIANSVIIIDEIQSYKNSIWAEIITFLKEFARIMNIKIIIMSATLPNLDVLTDGCEATARLITDKDKYFNNKFFKNRISELNYDLLYDDLTEEKLLNHVKSKIAKGKKILVEFIKKKTAKRFYELLKESDIEVEIELITGEDNLAERDRILSKIENAKEMILVATQVVEAGVDIDMDIGYKDISKLDSEEQFMGRINRSCKRKGEVYFFDLDNAREIYKDDVRMSKDITLLNEEMKKILKDKSFEKYYEKVLTFLKLENKKQNDGNLEMFWQEKVGRLDFPQIAKHMKLIDDDRIKYYIFLERNLTLKSGEILYGEKIWKEYKALLINQKINYAERQVKLSNVRSKMNYFIYEVGDIQLDYNDRLGELYYIKDGEKYLSNGKFDIEKLKVKSIFL